MENTNLYLTRYAYPETSAKKKPANDLGLIIVIPCYIEPDILDALNAIIRCSQPLVSVEVHIIINEPENCKSEVSETNKNTYTTVSRWIKEHSTQKICFFVDYCKALNKKHAGVGLARKIGMDNAVRRFEMINNHQNGIIACFDADSTCDQNYLIEIERHFKQYPETSACSIYFEHPLKGAYKDNIYEGIARYETYLRYYIDALRYASHPHAYQTIGSSMAVRSAVYQKQGGMNKRKAGEDFYFLHKIIPLGHFSEINTTRVIPSPRPSDRVPFGTGKAISDWLYKMNGTYPAYDPQIFKDLKKFISLIDTLFKAGNDDIEVFLEKAPDSIRTFLLNHNFYSHLAEINSYCGNRIDNFRKKFFQWMNGFKILKYVHYARDNYHKDIPIEVAAQWLIKEHLNMNDVPTNIFEQLKILREFDRRSPEKNLY